MTPSKILLAASILAIGTSFAYAGPGIQYWSQRRTAQNTVTKNVSPAPATKAAVPCCRVVTTQRPVASHKVSIQVKTVECSGCPAMAAGMKCPSS